MSDDISQLKQWAEQSQGIALAMAPEDDVLTAVARIDARAREAAGGLAFETEPATYARLLEAIADRYNPK